ncbi:SHOCT domain-containing protein [Streptomyces sp. B21-101]
MMFWYGHDPGGWGWFAMSVGMVVFWALLIAIAVLLSRALSQPSGSKASTGPEQPGAAAEQFLAERFARGQRSDRCRRTCPGRPWDSGGDGNRPCVRIGGLEGRRVRCP